MVREVKNFSAALENCFKFFTSLTITSPYNFSTLVKAHFWTA